MNRSFLALFFSLLLGVASVSAQNLDPVLREVNQSYEAVKLNLLKSAERMPNDGYAFKPGSANLTFGELIAEIAISQKTICSDLEGNRLSVSWNRPVNKTEAISVLKQSMQACDAAYRSVTNANAGQRVGLGTAQHTKLGLLILSVARNHEAYGRLSVYLQLRRISVPSEDARILPLE